MKALSLKQPWANLVANGDKTIEIRTWKTNFRGDFLIHASKNVDKSCIRAGTTDEPRGVLIAIARLTWVIKYDDFDVFKSDMGLHLNYHITREDLPLYGFLLNTVRKIKPIPFKGARNFFETNLTQWDIRTLDSIEYLKCCYCGHLNELKLCWRSTGDDDDTHHIICKRCKRGIGINNQDTDSPFLIRGSPYKRLYMNCV